METEIRTHDVHSLPSCVTKMDKLQDIYYQPNHLWKGQKAIRKLQELSKERPAVIKKWMSPQAIWKVHLPPAKRVNRPHYKVKISQSDASV